MREGLEKGCSALVDKNEVGSSYTMFIQSHIPGQLRYPLPVWSVDPQTHHSRKKQDNFPHTRSILILKPHILGTLSVLGKTGQLFILALNPNSNSLTLPMMLNTCAAKLWFKRCNGSHISHNPHLSQG